MRNILGDFQWFQEGYGLVALVEEATLPDVKWKMEDYMGGGLMGTRSIKTIFEKMELRIKVAGKDPRMIDAVTMMPGQAMNYKLMSSFIVPGEEEIPEKVLVSGVVSELKRDVYKAGAKSMSEYMITDITFYEEWFDGKLRIQIDLLNQVLIGADGVDLMATRRRNTGRL